MEECVKLLQGTNDEQRLVGLLLATKFVAGDDPEAVRKVFDAIGFPFLNRLLKTGTGQARGVGEQDREQQQAYLHLALSIVAAFCRVPELASMDDSISKVPILVQTLASKEDEAVAVDCFECLLAIGAASEEGLEMLHRHKVLSVVAHQVQDPPPGAAWIPVALRLLQFLLVTATVDKEIAESAQALSGVIPVVARQLAYQQDVLKFEALSLLRSLLASPFSMPIRSAVQRAPLNLDWPAQVRSGVGLMLHNRVAVEHKQSILEVAEAIVELVGENWLSGPMHLADETKSYPSDRFFILVVETLRVETAVLLNEVSRMTFDSGGGAAAQTAEATKHQQGLATFFSLLEHVMNVVSEQQEAAGRLGEFAMERSVVALDEVVGVVLWFLEDAQEHGATCGDLLLAAVRLVGRYLAEAPSAHRNRTFKLLGLLLSVTREGQEGAAVQAVGFMLPALSQMTTEVEGCKALVYCGGHKQIVEFVRVAVQNGGQDTHGPVVDACDTLLNLLIKKDGVGSMVKAIDFIPALPALAAWAVQGKQMMEGALAASLCTMVLGLTNEHALLQFPGFGPAGLHTIFHLILINLERCQRAERLEEPAEEEDLWDITVSGCASCMQRYPSLKQMIKASAWLQRFLGKRPMTATMDEVTMNASLQMLLASILTN